MTEPAVTGGNDKGDSDAQSPGRPARVRAPAVRHLTSTPGDFTHDVVTDITPVAVAGHRSVICPG
jgi:hypothetical protein